MIKAISRSFYTGWKLLRFIAVASSSIATILSSMLPIFSSADTAIGYLLLMLVFLSMGAILIHGILTHLLNDYTDFQSGTDAHSPAILSGGSRVIQEGLMRPKIMWKLGKWLAVTLLTIGILLAFFSAVRTNDIISRWRLGSSFLLITIYKTKLYALFR